jgi:hypothetical protein
MKLSHLIALPFLFSLGSASPSGEVYEAKRACTSFTDALTSKSGCCDPTTSSLYWISQLLGLGICCPLGQVLDGFTCTAPATTTNTTTFGDAVCPKQIGSDLGIQYGHCYVLLSLNHNYLGHDSATKYVVEGENPGVVFRVCGDTDECLTSADTLVPANGTWWMQDQFGDPSGTGFGWLGGSGDLTVQDNSTTSLVLGGSPTTYGGKCAVCIGFPPGGAHAPCPLSPGQSHLGVASNPNSCQPFFFQEVPCRSEQ